MHERMRITDRLYVGAQPTEEQLKQLADDGFQAVVNLRVEGEDEQLLSPQDEGEKVTELGMLYLNLPVSLQNMRPELVDQFREQLGKLAAPVYVHCHQGKRAGAFAMMHTSIEAGHTGEQTLRMAEQMGFECDVPELQEFVSSYIDQNRK